MEIRKANLQDAAELARLRWDFSPDEQASQPFSDFVEEFARWLNEALADGKWTIFVVESEGRLLANMYLNQVGKVPRPGHIDRAWGYVTNVYAEPSTRGQGIGTRLLSQVVAWAQAEGLELLLLWPSEEAVPFYERAGFVRSPEALELSLQQDL